MILSKHEGFPTNQKAKVADVSKFGRAVSEFYLVIIFIYVFVVLIQLLSLDE